MERDCEQHDYNPDVEGPPKHTECYRCRKMYRRHVAERQENERLAAMLTGRKPVKGKLDSLSLGSNNVDLFIIDDPESEKGGGT